MVAFALTFTPPTLAAVRCAGPRAAAGGEPCNPTPCALANAVNKAANGDQVIVTPGSYAPNVEINLNHSIDVGGQPGGPVPVVALAVPTVHVQNAGAVLHDLRLELPEPTMGYTLILDAGTVDRVYSNAPNAAGACQVSGGLLRDSVCRGGLNVSSGTPGPARADLRNVTATTLLLGAFGGAKLTAEAINVIAHSEGTAFGGNDVALDVSAGSSGSFTLSHSNFATVETSLSSGTEFAFHGAWHERESDCSTGIRQCRGGRLPRGGRLADHQRRHRRPPERRRRPSRAGRAHWLRALAVPRRRTSAPTSSSRPRPVSSRPTSSISAS